ncbi:uncharacterized protein LOC130507222, partial [Raphanus sativus]|uniref:Uncharacterized protein LOC130507222 n=1 Tax=Raphanus sativus TaxID=3726 RepID=A0A9W3D2H0_RAPSA
EDPIDHLYKFDQYCSLSKTNGVSEDAFKLKMFPFSLGDKAHQWERTEQDAEELVENMAKSDSVYNEEYDRANRGDDQQTRKDIKSLQDKKEPNFQYNNYQQRPYSNNQQGGYQPRNNQQGSHQPQQNSPPGFSNKGNQSTQAQGSSSQHQAQDTSVESMFKQLLEAQSRKVDEIEKLVFGTELGKVEQLVVATAEAQMVDKAIERVHVQAERKVQTTNLQRAEPRVEKPVERRADQKLNEVKQEDIEVELSPYDKVPFPQRVLTKAQKKVISKFRKDLSDVGVRLPEISGMREAHVQMMLIKDILDHQAEVAELLDISILKIDPPVPPQSLPKLESQGKFTLSCSLGTITMNDALVDSGASVNVISLEMVKSLGIESMEPNTSSLMFGDSSSTTPIGLIKDFPLKIGACTIPIDLTVLKMTTEKRVPLILGTPFLTTVGACIDFPNKKVTLLNVNRAVSYPIQSPIDVGYCGTITCEEPSIEKTQAKVVVPEKEGLIGESSRELCVEHLESAKREEVSRAGKAAHDMTKIVKEPHPSPFDKTPQTLTLHPMKLKDGAIEYKIKCKGRSKPFSSTRAIITPQLRNDPIKLQELLSQVLTITLEEVSGQLKAQALDTHYHTSLST